MRPGVIVLNGGSSSGKSSIATCLQRRLEGTWLTLGIDDLIRALSHGPTDTSAGGTLEFRSDGSIVVHAAFRHAETGWYVGLGAMARVATPLIIDEVFLDGGNSQARLRIALEGLSVVWVGVQCQAPVAEARELQRSDRKIGLARDQAERVHRGVGYDVVVDTSAGSPDACASAIMSWLTDHDS
jgi:chloramphenicol 3-O phosphotransferase